MKNVLKLTFLCAALTISGSILAQDGNKANSPNTEKQKKQINTSSQSGNSVTPVKKSKPKPAESQKGESKAATKNAVSTPSTPAGMAISENGVATPSKGKVAATTTEPAAPATPATPAAPASPAVEPK